MWLLSLNIFVLEKAGQGPKLEIELRHGRGGDALGQFPERFGVEECCVGSLLGGVQIHSQYDRRKVYCVWSGKDD